jgi:hypothetical protein
MSDPVIRSFAQDTEIRFPEEDTVPKDMKEWWVETRENLDRIKDKMSSLQVENQSLRNQLSAVTNQFTDAQAEQLARFIQFWEIASNGSLIPYTNNASDLGSAERKVRDIYEAI